MTERVLATVPYDEIKVGMRTKSLLTGNEGRVGLLLPKEMDNSKEDNIIVIDWDAQHCSWCRHFEYDKVVLLAPTTQSIT